MTTGNTTLLGLALPVDGELDGTWGDAVNTQITSLLDSAVAGTTTLSADADVTLTSTVLAANQARQAVLLWNATSAVTRNITAPAQSKPYIVINAGTNSVVLRGAGPTTGITIVSGERCLAAFNGSDFVKVSSSTTGDVVGPASATDNAITRFDATTGKLIQNSLVTIADNGAITAPDVGSVIPFYFANQAAFPSAATYHGALAHSHADGAMFFAHAGAWIRLLDAAATVTVAQGGTGLATLTANNVIIGNGTSAPSFVAPGTDGNVLTASGGTWASAAPSPGGITTGKSIAMAMIFGF